MVKYSRQSVCLYKYLLRGGGGGGVRHWYALFVFLRRQRHAVSLHEAISYLISTDTHGSWGGGSPADSTPFHSPLYRPGKWLPVPLLPVPLLPVPFLPPWQANLISAVISPL